MARRAPTIVAVALNPAIDRVLEVPGLAIGRHQRGRLVSIQPAGKAVNVARFLGALGAQCILTGFVGQAERHHFESSFEKTPVRVEMFDARGPTRENITLVDPDAGAETHVRDVGNPLSEEDLERLSRKLAILGTKGAYVVFAGSLTPGMEADAFAILLKRCVTKGAMVAVDSSGPGLEAVARTDGLWLAKPNRDELAELTGRPAGTEAEVRLGAEALRRRIENVVVTLGAEGAMLFWRQGAWRARPVVDPQAVLKTVGAGDALLAGFIHAHSTGQPIQECLRQGVACGTAATLQLRAGVVNPYDVKSCLERVELTAMK